MKIRTPVWTLSWDTDGGTNCQVFGSEAEWEDFFRKIIESSISDIDDSAADEIRSQLSRGDFGQAYVLWQDTYKPELDTYNWGTQEIEIEVQSILV